MSTLTAEGRRLVLDLARRHGFGEEAVSHLLEAIDKGHGRMAQFSHPELGGNGQWMAGGLLMIGDMFDHALKNRVGALCTDLANALDATNSSTSAVPSSSRSGRGDESDAGASSGAPLFTASASSAWWPSTLGSPSATGSQGAMRYAYFADARRLAIDDGGAVRVHDTGDHRIGGFSQQQGGGRGLSASSQHGTFDPTMLPLVSDDDRTDDRTDSRANDRTDGRAGERTEERIAASRPEPHTSPAADDAERAAGATGEDRAVRTDAESDDPIALIERLGALHERGVLTDEEFAAKKAELLARL